MSYAQAPPAFEFTPPTPCTSNNSIMAVDPSLMRPLVPRPLSKRRPSRISQVAGPVDSTPVEKELPEIRAEDVTARTLMPCTTGGFANVWKCQWKGLCVALKQLKAHESPARGLRRFKQEARVWISLEHRNILPLLGVYIDPEGANCMISLWLDHGHINGFLKSNPSADRLKLISDIISGVQYLHTRNPPVVHGDLRGDNVLISDGHDACLVDFGLSGFLDGGDLGVSQPTSLRQAGAVRWMAPELFCFPSPTKTCDSDIYSFSMLIIEIYTGKIPFHEERNEFKIPQFIMEGGRPPHPGHHAIEIGFVDPLWDLVQQCWRGDSPFPSSMSMTTLPSSIPTDPNPPRPSAFTVSHEIEVIRLTRGMASHLELERPAPGPNFGVSVKDQVQNQLDRVASQDFTDVIPISGDDASLSKGLNPIPASEPHRMKPLPKLSIANRSQSSNVPPDASSWLLSPLLTRTMTRPPWYGTRLDILTPSSTQPAACPAPHRRESPFQEFTRYEVCRNGVLYRKPPDADDRTRIVHLEHHGAKSTSFPPYPTNGSILPCIGFAVIEDSLSDVSHFGLVHAFGGADPTKSSPNLAILSLDDPLCQAYAEDIFQRQDNHPDTRPQALLAFVADLHDMRDLRGIPDEAKSPDSARCPPKFTRPPSSIGWGNPNRVNRSLKFGNGSTQSFASSVLYRQTSTDTDTDTNSSFGGSHHVYGNHNATSSGVLTPGLGSNVSFSWSAESHDSRGGTSYTTADLDDVTTIERREAEDRLRIIKEILQSERQYVRQLDELVHIYVKPSAARVRTFLGVAGREKIIPSDERRFVFNGVETLLSFHRSLLRSIEKPCNLMRTSPAVDSSTIAAALAEVFVRHGEYMKMYHSYIHDLDQRVACARKWSEKSSSENTPLKDAGITSMSINRQKRVRSFIAGCRLHSRHSPFGLEHYLLLPAQRIPQYRGLFQRLSHLMPRTSPVHRAYDILSSLDTNIQDAQEAFAARLKLLQWQRKIKGTLPFSLVQPHRQFIMDGTFELERIVRPIPHSIEISDESGEPQRILLETISTNSTRESLIGILCSDMLVLCRAPTPLTETDGPVDLIDILHMRNSLEPASIVYGHHLRIADDRGIWYLNAFTMSDALMWLQAINTHIPASRIQV